MPGYRDIKSTGMSADGTAAFEHGQAAEFDATSKHVGFLGFYGADLGSSRPTEGRVPAFYALAKRAGSGGRYVENAASVADALHQTGLDFEVRHESITARHTQTVLGDDGELVEQEVGRLDMPNWVATVAYPKDGGAPFAIAPTRKSYTIVQNEEALAVGDAISEGRLVAVGAYGNPIGSKVYAAYELGEGMTIAGDPYRNFLTITTTHDRSAGLSALLAPIRLGCTNQTTATFGRAVPRFTIRHTGAKDVKVEEARRVLGIAKTYLEVFVAKSEDLLKIKMTKDAFVKFERRVFGVADDAEGRTLKLAQARDEQLLQILSSQSNEMAKGTAYDAVNAVIEWADWFSPVRGKDGDLVRATRQLDGGADTVKQRAYDLAFALA